MVLKIVVISAVLFCFGIFTHAEFSNCGSQFGNLVNAVIEGCNKPRCLLKKGNNYTIDIDFSSRVNSTHLTAVANTKFLNRSFKLTIPNSNGCNGSGIVCPIKDGESYSYSTTVPIRTTYPKLQSNISWKLQNDDGNNIVCASIPIEITD